MRNLYKRIFILFEACILLLCFNCTQAQLVLTPGSHFVINGTPTLTLNNAGIKNYGTFVPGSGTVNFTGYSDTSVSNIIGDSTTTISNLSVTKPAYGVAVKGAVWVTNVLTMATGNLYANSNLTLKSTAANTARVAPVPGSCVISGKANVERYYPSHRAWRLMTAPQTNVGTIYDQWENGQVYAAGRGTYITGPGPNSSNGLDASPQNNYSLYTYNYSTQKFNVVTNTKVNLSPGSSGSADNSGYMIFVRGDRSNANLYLPNSNITTLNSLGVLQTGTQTFNVSSVAGSFAIIGNPYASPIDFGTVTRSNVINRFYAWDPNLNTIGGFVVIDDAGNTGTYIKSVLGSNETQILQSTQAFFIQTQASGTATITFNESNKSTTNNNLVFRPAAPTPGMRVILYLLNDDSSTTLADGAFAQFNDSFNDSVTFEDAPKLSNMSEMLSFARYGKNLSIERRPTITANDTLFLQLTQYTGHNYQLEFVGENFESDGLTPYLEDSYLGTSTPLDMTADNKINFSVSGDSSSVANRFRIVFKMETPLAVTFTTVKAYQENTGIAVQWNVENELNIAQYEVEKSVDGTNFTEMAIIKATGNNNSSVAYNWLDTKPAAGDNYYRIKSIDKNGIIKYSQVVRVAINKAGSDISIYPNPVTGNVVNLQFGNEPQGNYEVQLLGKNGALIYTKAISVTSDNMVQSLSLPSSLARGSYEVKITSTGNVEKIESILIQ
jgi:hypothetical protein